MKIIKKSLLFILALSIILTACGKNIETEIIGSWEGVSLKQNFHFYADGRVELNDLKYSLYRGTYTIIDGNTLECKFDPFTYPVIRKVKIKSNKLILIDKNGIEEIYRRDI